MFSMLVFGASSKLRSKFCLPSMRTMITRATFSSGLFFCSSIFLSLSDKGVIPYIESNRPVNSHCPFSVWEQLVWLDSAITKIKLKLNLVNYHWALSSHRIESTNTIKWSTRLEPLQIYLMFKMDLITFWCWSLLINFLILLFTVLNSHSLHTTQYLANSIKFTCNPYIKSMIL